MSAHYTKSGWTHAVAVLAAAALVTLAVTWSSPAHAAGLLIAQGGLGGVLEIEEHAVEVTINNGVAVTEVTQVFRNTENRQVEALYTFPVPKGASVANFSMWINGKEMIGEVLEKKRAREIYESYKRVRRDPGLLEQTDYKTFEMRIFPIAAGAQQKVKVTYYQELDFDNDWASYVYPLATVTRSGVDARTKGRFALTLHVKSEVPIVKMESPSHGKDFVIANHAADYVQASLETTGGDLNRDLVLAYQVERPRTGLDLITSREPGDDGYFCLTLTAGKELKQRDLGMDYVFVLDVSGSMEHGRKLSLSRDSVGAFIDGLGEKDRFEVITFNVTPTTLFKKLGKVDGATRKQAADFLASQNARGGTVLRPALQAAYRYADPDRVLNVVILSDGMTEQRERRELVQAIRGRPSNARVFCIGVGNEVNRPLLKQLAEEAGGLAAFLSRGDDFKRQANAFRRKLMHPVATNIHVDFGKLQVYDVVPQQAPNLYHGAPVRVYGRYRDDGPATVTLKAEIEGREIRTGGEMTFPKTDDANPEIERMWAWHRAQDLLRQTDDGSRQSIIDEVVRLGEAYSIATEYTSFIVLENDREYKRWRIERRNALRIKRDRRKREELAAQLERMRTKAVANIGPLEEAEPISAPAPGSQTTRKTSAPPRRRDRGQNIDLFPDIGGGPVGPFIGVILGGMALVEWRRRRRHRKNG